MVFWIGIGAILAATVLVLANALRARDQGESDDEQSTARVFYAQQLAELEQDLAASKFEQREFEAAKLELDREFLRQTEAAKSVLNPYGPTNLLVGVSILAILGITAVTYVGVGNPGLSNAPLSQRIAQGADIDIKDAVLKIEQRLFDVPDDLQGWKVIAPIYMRQQSYENAAIAFRNIVRLEGESADNLTNLAEAVMLSQQGDAAGEPMELLNRAMSIDPDHLRSQFYVAGEATRSGDHDLAIGLWEKILGVAVGNEPWLATARAGLRVAQEGAGIVPDAQNGPSDEDVKAAAEMSDADRGEMINNMVAGLSERLLNEGGSPQEWQRLLRARVVQGDLDAAKMALGAARTNLAADAPALEQFELLARTEITQIENVEK
ncbi:c-type cytochrome biogenesis protein CcmI [Maritalea sp.]|uniref:c-type cytochrome biogenesis protein CcmI n=1 Tax=Maritalea sp. TaxID=2003361 RepID=UPI003EF43FC2